MTLQGTVFFPHAVMPLFIFEQRYRDMLRDVLSSHRLFAVFNEREAEPDEGHEEPPQVMGTVGIVRAAHQNPDGTSNLALQGIARVRLLEIVRESPYRLIRVDTCQDAEDGEDSLPSIREEIVDLLKSQPHLTRGLPEEYVKFIHSLTTEGPFIDVTIHSICHDTNTKQQLLETLSLRRRFKLFLKFLRTECMRHELFKLLQGNTTDDEIELN
jgi:Lon protease-like protein